MIKKKILSCMGIFMGGIFTGLLAYAIYDTLDALHDETCAMFDDHGYGDEEDEEDSEE